MCVIVVGAGIADERGVVVGDAELWGAEFGAYGVLGELYMLAFMYFLGKSRKRKDKREGD